jgi:hypothetical protein
MVGRLSVRTMIALAAIALLVAVGCSSSPAVSAATLRDAATKTVESGSAGLTFGITFKGSQVIPDGTEIKGKGATEFGAVRRMAMEMDMTDLDAGTIEVMMDGTDSYMRSDSFASLTGDGDTWLYVDLTSDGEMAKEFASIFEGQNDASLLVYYLFGATGEVSTLGTEAISGVSTTHYAAALDLQAALDVVDPAVKPILASNLEDLKAAGVTGSVDGEAWIDGDGLVRRISYAYPLGAVAGGGAMTLIVELTDHGKPITLDLPTKDEFVSIDDLTP